MKPLRNMFFLFTLLTAFFLVSPASAHRPDQGNTLGITPIQSPTTSYAFYRELTNSSDVHLYSFEGQSGQFFHAGINIPQIGGLEDYGVTLALIGPGLPPLESSKLPFAVNLTPGALPSLSGSNPILTGVQTGTFGGSLTSNVRGKDFFEPFTQTNYWGRQTVELTLPETGTYYVIVWNPDGQPGKYVMDTGTEEVFGPGDLLVFPKWWVDTHVYFGHTPYLVGSAAVLLMGVFGIVILRKRQS